MMNKACIRGTNRCVMLRMQVVVIAVFNVLKPVVIMISIAGFFQQVAHVSVLPFLVPETTAVGLGMVEVGGDFCCPNPPAASMH
jgi:hypothetical protein